MLIAIKSSALNSFYGHVIDIEGSKLKIGQWNEPCEFVDGFTDITNSYRWTNWDNLFPTSDVPTLTIESSERAETSLARYLEAQGVCFRKMVPNEDDEEVAVSLNMDERVPDVELLSNIFYAIETWFEQRNLEYVDEVLEEFEPSLFNPIISTGLLRCTSRAKNLLRYWNKCRDLVQADLETRGLDSKHLMRGLLDG